MGWSSKHYVSCDNWRIFGLIPTPNTAQFLGQIDGKIDSESAIWFFMILPGILPLCTATWRIIPFCKWLITMVSKSPNWGYSPSKWHTWRINGGDPNYLLSGMILQPGRSKSSSCISLQSRKVITPASPPARLWRHRTSETPPQQKTELETAILQQSIT